MGKGLAIDRRRQKDLIKALVGNKAIKLKIRMYAQFAVSAKCNFRCIHCYIPFSSPKNKYKKELTTSEVYSVLDQLADMGTLFLVLTGGEPFLRPDFWKIIEYARKREFAVSLFTNGSFITEEVAQRLADYSIYYVYVSLYGMNEHVYKSITGVSGVFKKVVQGLESLKRKGVRASLKVVLLRENFFQLEAFEKFAKRMGIPHYFFWWIFPQLDRCQAPLKHRLSESQIEEFLCLHSEDCEPVLSSTPPTSGQLCGSANGDEIFINYDGTVMPCFLLENYVDIESNVRKKPIAEIIKKSPLFKRLKNMCYRDIPQCMKCEALIYCKPCPGPSAVMTGSLTPHTSKALCEIPWLMKKVHERIQNDTNTFKISGKSCTER